MADILRTGSAVWMGGRDGGSKVSTGSGTLRDATVTVGSRFESATGTNPEELIAAAHASCYSMQFSILLANAGHPPTEVKVKTTLSAKRLEIGWTIYKMHLDCEAKVPGIDAAKFQEIAIKAKEICPISRLLKPGLEELTLDAKLV